MFVIAKADDDFDHRLSSVLYSPAAMPVPAKTVSKMITVRSGVPDRVVRAEQLFRNDHDTDLKLLCHLRDGILLVPLDAFNRWYKQEKRKGSWPSQPKAGSKRRGARTKQTPALRHRIIELIRAEEWRPSDGVSTLHRMLLKEDPRGTPSRETIGRLLDQLHLETGDPLFLKKRNRNRMKLD